MRNKSPTPLEGKVDEQLLSVSGTPLIVEEIVYMPDRMPARVETERSFLCRQRSTSRVVRHPGPGVHPRTPPRSILEYFHVLTQGFPYGHSRHDANLSPLQPAASYHFWRGRRTGVIISHCTKPFLLHPGHVSPHRHPATSLELVGELHGVHNHALHSANSQHGPGEDGVEQLHLFEPQIPPELSEEVASTLRSCHQSTTCSQCCFIIGQDVTYVFKHGLSLAS